MKLKNCLANALVLILIGAISSCKSISKAKVASVELSPLDELKSICSFKSVTKANGIESQIPQRGFSYLLKEDAVQEVCKQKATDLSLINVLLYFGTQSTLGFNATYYPQLEAHLDYFLAKSTLRADVRFNSEYFGDLYNKNPTQAKEEFLALVNAAAQLGRSASSILAFRQKGVAVQIGDDHCYSLYEVSFSGNYPQYTQRFSRFTQSWQDAVTQMEKEWQDAVTQMEKDLKTVPAGSKVLFSFGGKSECIRELHPEYKSFSNYTPHS